MIFLDCRLIGFVANDPLVVEELIGALSKSAMRDFLAEELGFSSHDHGWGYAVASRLRKRWSISFYKTVIPIWEDPHHVDLNGNLFMGIVHARKASKNTPINTFSAHPYMYVLDDGSWMFLAQNGGINRELGLELLEKKPTSLKTEEVTDTFVYGLLLREAYSKSEGEAANRMLNAIQSLDEHLVKKSAGGRCMNTFVLQYTPNDAPFLFAVRAIYGEKVKDYCELYLVEKDESFCFASSTTSLILEQAGFKIRKIGANEISVVSLRDGIPKIETFKHI